MWGKSGAGLPVSTCTIGAMVRRIWAILGASVGLRVLGAILANLRSSSSDCDVGFDLFAFLLIPLVLLMRGVCMKNESSPDLVSLGGVKDGDVSEYLTSVCCGKRIFCG